LPPGKAEKNPIIQVVGCPCRAALMRSGVCVAGHNIGRINRSISEQPE
jgi:hypothetical protein